MANIAGTIIALCISSKGGVPKYPQEKIEVGQYGFIGDFHAGSTRISRKTGKSKINDRQITLVAQEALDIVNIELGISLKPGDLGENITTIGLGNLSGINGGVLLLAEGVEGMVLFRVVEQNDPCSNLSIYHKQLPKKTMGKRGVLAIVSQGAGVHLRPGAKICIVEKKLDVAFQ